MPPRTKAAFLFVGLLACARAQSVESIPIRARLSSTIPGGTANGSVTIRLRVVRNAAGNIVDGSAVLALRYRFASAVTLTEVRILRGSGVALAEGLSESDPTGQGGVSRTFPLNRAGVEALLLPGRLALEVATSDSPEGALRGPLEMADEAILLGQLGTGTPPRGGLATIRLMATRDPRGRLTSAEIRWRITAGGPHVGSVRLASGADGIQLAGPESTNGPTPITRGSRIPASRRPRRRRPGTCSKCATRRPRARRRGRT